MLLNLLVNAFDATPGGGRVVIEGVACSAKERPGIAIAVSDTGPGISAEALESLFDSFVTTKPGGMGMGLSVSRSIVRAHEGRIWAENNRDGGATFHVVLPALAGRGEVI